MSLEVQGIAYSSPMRAAFAEDIKADSWLQSLFTLYIIPCDTGFE